MAEDKRNLRAAVASRRRSLPQSEAFLWSRLIQERVLAFRLYLEARTVVLYSPIQNEVATDEIRNHALNDGKAVFYPKYRRGDDVDLVKVNSSADLHMGRLGILEPSGEERLSEPCRDGLVVFVPGVAFDLQGHRLGRGKGWYDRLLERVGERAGRVALAYEFQIVDEVPTDHWDQNVQSIITERRVIDCGTNPSRVHWAF